MTARRRRQIGKTMERIKRRLWALANELGGTQEGEELADLACHVDDVWGTIDPERK